MIVLDFRPQWMFLVELMSQVKSEPFGSGYIFHFLSRGETTAGFPCCVGAEASTFKPRPSGVLCSVDAVRLVFRLSWFPGEDLPRFTVRFPGN